MRALHWPDAFPGGDLMLQKAAKTRQKGIAGARGRLATVACLCRSLPMAIVGRSSMNRYTYLDSPIGPLLLCSRRRGPDRPLYGQSRAARRSMAANGPRMRARLRCPRRCGSCANILRARGANSICRCASQGTAFQQRVWRSLTEIPLRRNLELRTIGEAHRQSERLARRGVGQRPQSDLDSGSLPSRDRRRRLADRIRRRTRAQALAAGARGIALAGGGRPRFHREGHKSVNVL